MNDNRKSPINGAELPRGKPFEPGEEAREKAKMGGQKSVASRRKKKTLREELQYLLNQEITDKKGNRYIAHEAISLALIGAAVAGNVKAYEVIRDTIGEKPAENVQIAVPDKSVRAEIRRRMEDDAL